MSITHEIQISMTPSTVVALLSGGYQLAVCKGVLTTINEGSPVIWYTTSALQLNLVLSWRAQYQAYTSLAEIVSGAAIVPSATYDIGLGQTFQVINADGTGVVSQGGVPNGITILGQSPAPVNCGLKQSIMGGVSPVCALPVSENSVEVIMPIEKVLLMFTSTLVRPGTMVARSLASSLLVDLRGASSRTVGYDINRGWSWGGAPWAMPVAPNAELAPLLVGSSPFLLQHAARTRLVSAGLANLPSATP